MEEASTMCETSVMEAKAFKHPSVREKKIEATEPVKLLSSRQWIINGRTVAIYHDQGQDKVLHSLRQQVSAELQKEMVQINILPNRPK